MKVAFDKSFYSRLVNIKDKTILEKVKQTILQVEAANDVSQIANLKKMNGFKTYCRIRIGDYMIGVELKKDTIWFITVANRKDIYRNFP